MICADHFHYRSEANNKDAGNHPWQRRIQGLKDLQNERSDHAARDTSHMSRDLPEPAMHPAEAVQSAHTNQSSSDVNTDTSNFTPGGGFRHPVTQDLNIDFCGHGNVLFDDNHLMNSLYGSVETQVVPGLANFMSTSGEWMAYGFSNDC